MTTCSTLDALYAAILANPHEDTPRLVYADALDEQGDTSGRAEFIRVQCELAKYPPTVPWDTFTSSAKAEFAAVREDDPRREKLERREQELLTAHVLDWAGDEFLPFEAASGKIPIFRRGFVDEVAVPDVTPISDLLRRHPLSVVMLPTCAVAIGPEDDEWVVEIVGDRHAKWVFASRAAMVWDVGALLEGVLA